MAANGGSAGVDHRAFRLAVMRSQAAVAMLATAAVVAGISLINWLSGIPLTIERKIDPVTVLLLLLGAWVTHRTSISDRLVTWIAAALAAVLMASVVLQASITHQDEGYAYSLLILLTYGSIVLAWLPTLAAAVPMLAVGAWGIDQLENHARINWILLTLAALATGLILMHLRMLTLKHLAVSNARALDSATHDSLTGVLNRPGLEDRLPSLVAMAERRREGLFAAFIDADHLKSANDTYGHEFGDEVLLAVAHAIVARMRAEDLVARWGGDEFVVVGLGRPEQPDSLEARLHEHIAACGIDLTKWPGEVSVGTAWDEPGGAGVHFDVECLLGAADADMYARRLRRRGTGTWHAA